MYSIFVKKIFFFVFFLLGALFSFFADDVLQKEENGALRHSAEGVGENEEAIFSDRIAAEGETSPTKETENESENIFHLYTYIDTPVVEQRQVFSSSEIQESHTESLVDFLQSQGMQLLSYGAYGLESKPQIRGFTDETVRVVLDGICVNNAQYGTFDFTSINIDDIERIEIVRGGFTEGVSDEGSVAGTVYITTKKQALGINFTSNTFVKSFLNATNPFDTFSQSANASFQIKENTFAKTSVKGTYAQNKFQYKDFSGKNTTRKNSSVKDLHADAKVSHFFGNGSSFTTGAIFYAGEKNCPGTATQTYSGVQKDFDSIVNFSLVNPAIKNKIKLENNAAWLFNKRNYEENNSESLHKINTFKYAGYASSHFTDFYAQNAGLTLDAVHLDSTDDGKHFLLSFAAKETSTFYLGRFFTVTVPLAVKVSGENAAFIPKLGLKFSTQTFDFLLNGYRMVQFPNMDDLYWNGSGAKGNPDLDVEQGFGTEATFNLKKWIPFSLCFFSNYYENKIQWAFANGVYSPQNVASAFYYGIDFRTEKSFFEDFIELKFNAEYLYSALLDKSNKLTYKKRIMWTPDWTFASSATFNFFNVHASFEWNYIGKRYKSNLNITYMEPYSLFNVNVSYGGFKHFVPYLRAENIFDTKYESVDSYPMPGFSLTVGLRSSLR